MARQVASNETEARAQFQSVFKAISAVNLTDEQFRIYVAHFATVGAADIFAQVPEEYHASLASAMGEPNVESAVAKLTRMGLSALPQGRVSNDRIVFSVNGKRTEIKINPLFENAKFKDGAASQSVRLSALYDDMTKTPALYRIALAQLPSDMLGVALETALRKETDQGARREVIDSIERDLSSLVNQQARQQLVNEALGASVMQDLVLRKEAASRMNVPTTFQQSGGSTTGLSPEASAAATAALNYAMPGAGVALSMAQSFAQMSANSKEMNRLADQSLRIMAEQEQLYDLATEAYFQYAIANVEEARADALRDSAERQLGVFSAELARRAISSQSPLAAIGLRRGLTYYLAERMREEFDLFDRSFAMWSAGAAARGAIAAEVQRDPHNTRYALDSDIHLFDWLNRERESTRGDPDTLLVHWRQMMAVARDICSKRGCKPGDGNLGQIATTGRISAKDELITATEWKRFQDWQRHGSGQFVMQFAVLPANRLVPLQYENIRIIDLRLAGSKGGVNFVPHQMALRHLGISQIPRADSNSRGGIVFQREALLPKQVAAFALPTDFNVNALQIRYNNATTSNSYPALLEFEGYGLYAMYQLTLENTAENRSLDDIHLNVAYFYNDASNIVSEEQYLNSIRPTSGGLPFNIYNYQLHTKSSPKCAGQPGAPAATDSQVPISNAMLTSLSTVFNRRSEPATLRAPGVGLLSIADQGHIEAMRSCLETRVELVCKPIAEIRRVAASWAAASADAPALRRDNTFDALRVADDSKVPKAYRDEYNKLCGKGT